MADFFESILYQEMHLLIQDGSTEEVSDLLLDFYDKCSSNMSEEAVIAAVRTLPKCDLSKCQVKQDEDESPVAAGFIFVHTFLVQKRKCSPFLEVTPTL